MTQGTSRTGRAVLRPVECGPGVTVHSSADRRTAVRQWLLSSLGDHGRDRARLEWQEESVTLLPLGTLFSAVRIPDQVVHTVARVHDPRMVAEWLTAALDDGPVIHDPRGRRYYALVPAGMPQRWHKAADDWRRLGAEFLGRDAYLGVPPVDVTELDAGTYASYWAVPMPSLGVLCDPTAVAQLMAAAARRLEQEAGT